MRPNPSAALEIVRPIACALALLAALAPVLAAEGGGDTAPAKEDPASLREALAATTARVALRYRFESVDDALFTQDGQASTLRTAVTAETGAYRGWSLLLEAENVADLGLADEHNNAGFGSLGNRETSRPVIADPALTELHQAHLRYETDGTAVVVGRQGVNLGDQRFVGTVGWRQNHQSYDLVSVSSRALPRTELTYLYLDNVNRIFGDNKAMASHVAQAVIDAGAVGKVTVYGLWLDYDRPADAGLSTATLGAELAGKRPLADGLSLLYEAELAEQSDHGDNPNEVDAGYAHLALGLAASRLTFRAGLEVLEGSPGSGSFSTPLATLHKFNGWADQFLATPPDGLEDLYLSLSGTVGKVGWTAVYHDFSAESTGADYGTEIDLQLTYKTAWAQSFGLKGALYSSDGFSRDVDKWMAWTAYTF